MFNFFNVYFCRYLALCLIIAFVFGVIFIYSVICRFVYLFYSEKQCNNLKWSLFVNIQYLYRLNYLFFHSFISVSIRSLLFIKFCLFIQLLVSVFVYLFTVAFYDIKTWITSIITSLPYLLPDKFKPDFLQWKLITD